MATQVDDYIGSVCLWAAGFNPVGWAYCYGQILPISENQALFSIIGSTYGGNGTSTYALPDMRGRVPVGMGQGPGLSNYGWGQKGGNEVITLRVDQLPRHNHGAELDLSSLNITVALKVQTGFNPPTNNPVDAYLGSSGSIKIYYSDTDNNLMAPAEVTIQGGVDTVGIGDSGLSQPVEILQPYIALNYIICTQGLYPSRN